MRALIFACAAIGVGAAYLPAALQPQISRDKAADKAAVQHSAKIRPVRASRDTAEIAASADGHFYVDADVNRESVHFIVDTGATAVVLRESDAESAGLRLRPGDFDHPVTTANGVTQAAQVTLETIAVGDVEVRNTPALVLSDDQLSVSLLGSSFLNRLKSYQVAGGKLVLQD